VLSDPNPETPEESEQNIAGQNASESSLPIPNEGLVNLAPIEDEDAAPEPVISVPVIGPPAPVEPVQAMPAQEMLVQEVAPKPEQAPSQRVQPKKA